MRIWSMQGPHQLAPHSAKFLSVAHDLVISIPFSESSVWNDFKMQIQLDELVKRFWAEKEL